MCFVFSGTLLLESKIQPDTAYQKQQVRASSSRWFEDEVDEDRFHLNHRLAWHLKMSHNLCILYIKNWYSIVLKL